MFWIDWVAVVMVGVGALFMLLSILSAVAMLPRLTPFYKRKWTILTVFKGFFLLGYLAFIVILVMELKLPVEFVTGVVFLGGAFFVFMVIRLSDTGKGMDKELCSKIFDPFLPPKKWAAVQDKGYPSPMT